jgi:hypothetical chaperone protein
MEKAHSNTILAIDFGTSNSIVGAVQDGRRIEALPLDSEAENPTLMRTLLYFANPDECYYGKSAIDKFIENEMEGRLFRSFKSHLPNSNYLGTMIDRRVLRLEDMIGIFLLELKKRSEKILGEKVDSVVLGRPARYSMDDVADGFALHRMQKAAEFAGFKQVRFVPEPLAAGLEFRRTLSDKKTVLIGDFGGGTSDFTIMKMSPDSFQKEDVLGVDGCSLAGDALDSVFMSERLNRTFGAKSRYKLPMSENRLSMPTMLIERLNKPAFIVHLKDKETYNFLQEVKKCALTEKDKQTLERLFVLIDDQQAFPFFEEIEKTKRQLSVSNSALFDFQYPELETSESFFASEFSTWADGIRSEIMNSVDRCLAQAALNDEAIDIVFLTGGTAHVPFIRKEFESRFGAEKLQGGAFFHSVLSGLIEAARLAA